MWPFKKSKPPKQQPKPEAKDPAKPDIPSKEAHQAALTIVVRTLPDWTGFAAYSRNATKDQLDDAKRRYDEFGKWIETQPSPNMRRALYSWLAHYRSNLREAYTELEQGNERRRYTRSQEDRDRDAAKRKRTEEIIGTLPNKPPGYRH